MSASGDIELQLVAGEPTTGLWCDRCLLPSAITVPVLMVDAGDGHLVGIAGQFTYCPDCKDQFVGPDEQDEDLTADEHDNIGW